VHLSAHALVILLDLHRNGLQRDVARDVHWWQRLRRRFSEGT
jgi:hypothetical protein